MKRIFAAIDVSDSARAAVSDYIEFLRGEFPQARVGWAKAEKLHLTVKFLGETDDGQLERFTGAVENAAKKFQPFALKIGGAGVFPSAQNARVLWLGVSDENNNLQKLSASLETECERRGFPKENRKFKAHLTVARLRQNTDLRLIEKHLSDALQIAEPFPVWEIVIYESELLPHGSRYSALLRCKLRQS